MERVSYQWAVRALNPKNDKDKKSIAHALAGIAYHILKSPEPGKPYYVVGYKYFGGEMTLGSELATPSQSERLEKLDKIRYSRT